MNCRNCPAYEVLKGGVFFFRPRKLHGWSTITCQAYGLNETLATAPGCTPDYFAYMSLVGILFFLGDDDVGDVGGMEGDFKTSSHGSYPKFAMAFFGRHVAACDWQT